MIEVRHPLPPEQSAAEDLSAAAFATHRNVYRPKINATISQYDSTSRLVALADGRVVGTVRYLQEGKRLHALGLAVHPREQRRGIGRALIARLIERARQLGCSVVSAYTILEAGQLPALSRLGFVVLSTGTPDVLESPGGGPLTEAYLELPVAREGDSVTEEGPPHAPPPEVPRMRDPNRPVRVDRRREVALMRAVWKRPGPSRH